MKNEKLKKDLVSAKKNEKTTIKKEKKKTVKIAEKNNNYVEERTFNLQRTLSNLIVLVFIACAIVIVVKVYYSLNDQISFHAKSLKANKYISDKDEALQNAYSDIFDINSKNEVMSSTNLNLAFVYDDVADDEDKLIENKNAPVPVLSEEDDYIMNDVGKSVAFKIFEKLQNRYKTLNTALNNLVGMNPVTIVRQYHYDGYSIIGKYNPEDPSHVKGKRHTWFIQNFSNVNLVYVDGDGNQIEEDNNIKDVMSMASVYSYYHEPYNSKNFLKHCYDLFDNSYSYVASISEVYYCSGCMHYDDPSISTMSETTYDITYDKIIDTHDMQKVDKKEIPYKAGTLKKMADDSYTVTDGSYEEYASKVKGGEKLTLNNYCPGHIDLNVKVTVMTIDASKGLPSIDKNFGNKGMYYTKDWHGWDKLMISKARELSYKDWEKEYGISISYIDFVKPLTQEEINYYLNRLGDNITPNRKKVVEVALRSVGRIPYYYGGKTSRFGYETNAFGTKIAADYKGRCLKGLDCSGWISWVYMTAFNKYIIKSEGTSKLSTEGVRITRKELLPGDIIVRPGIDSHVMMFLEWAPDGKVKVIHENGSVNNVSIATFDAYYPYYRRIINS